MATYNALNNVTLLLNASDAENDTISIYRINGTPVTGAVTTVDLPVGSLTVVHNSGAVTYDDGGDTSGHPSGGNNAANGSFSFTIWDGTDESPAYTATIQLNGLGGVTLTGGVNDAGWDVNYDAGTDGDYFVSAENGSDSSGDGSVGNPYATFAQAAAVLKAAGSGAGKAITLRNETGGGIYRGAQNINGLGGTSGNPFTIKGYGTEKPVFSGAEVLTGLTSCTSSDQARVGSNYANIYKSTVSNSKFSSFFNNNKGIPAVMGVNIHEDGTSLNLATDQADTSSEALYFQTYDGAFHLADTVLTSKPGSNWQVDGFIDTTVITSSKYTNAQLENAFCRVFHNPNITSTVVITNADVANNRIYVPGGMTVEGNVQTPPAARRKYSICNILPNMGPGQWGGIDNGDGTSTIYVWPNNPANISGKIEFSTAPHIFDLRESHLRFEGIKITQPGGVSNNDCQCITRLLNTDYIQDITLRHVYAGNVDGGQCDDRTKIIEPDNIGNFDAAYVTVERGKAAYGIAMGSWKGAGTSGRIKYYKGYWLGQAPIRNLGARDMIMAFLDFYKTGKGGHTNLMNWYNSGGYGADSLWVHGLRARDAVGYFVFKGASNIFITCCDIPASISGNNENRSISDDSGGSNTPLVSGTQAEIWNVLMTPDPAEMNAGGTLKYANSGDLLFRIKNIVTHGGLGGKAGGANTSNIIDRADNLVTRRDWWERGGDAQDPTTLSGITVQENLSQVYANAGAGDFSPASGSPLLSLTGANMSPLITALKAVFPASEVDSIIDKDILGKPLNHSAPKYGPYSDPNDWS